MFDIRKPVRRVVTGNDKNGKSRVFYDSDNPHRFARGGGSAITFNEIWTFDAAPAVLAVTEDAVDRPMSHSPPANGAHFRVIQSEQEDNGAIDQRVADDQFKKMNDGGLSERLEGARHWNMHRTRTVDYGVVTWGTRVHVLPDGDVPMKTGDVVIQLAHFHSWDSTAGPNIMLFDMIGGEYPNE